MRADTRPVFGASIYDLDRRRLRDYFVRMRRQEAPEDGDDAGWRILLTNTEIAVEDGVILAGMLLFGAAPKRFLPQAGIEAAACSGGKRTMPRGNARHCRSR